MNRLSALLAALSLMACNGDTDTDTDTDGMEGEELVPGVTCFDDGSRCVMSGTITSDLTLTSDVTWVLSGGVFFGDDTATNTLTIEPGTTIFGESATNGFLVIQRGSRIVADGTAQDPIVFTSSKAVGERGRGDWGGLVINGRAPTNTCDDAAAGVPGEAGTGFYCGEDAEDDSGVLRYVRSEFAGTLVNDTNELNAIAFQGVGRGTVVEYIQAHMNDDDGVEFFGGTVNAKYVVSTGHGDDLFDFTDGWTGKVQYAVLQQYSDAGDNGIEADNNEDAMDAAPRSKPMLQNFTIIGANGASTADIGVLLRHGVAGILSHLAVVGWGEACMDVDSAPTFANAFTAGGEGGFTGELQVLNSAFWCAAVADPTDEAFVFEDMFPEVGDSSALFSNAALAEAGECAVVDPMIVDPYNQATPGFSLAMDAPELDSATKIDDPFFTATTFIGGVGPTDWTAGWTTSAQN